MPGEFTEPILFTLGHDFNIAIRKVADPPGQAQAARCMADEEPITYALNSPMNGEVFRADATIHYAFTVSVELQAFIPPVTFVRVSKPSRSRILVAMDERKPLAQMTVMGNWRSQD